MVARDIEREGKDSGARSQESGTGHGRQRDGECRLLRFAHDVDLSTVQFDDSPRLGKPQSQTAACLSPGKERIEDVRADFRRNSGAAVGDRENEMRSGKRGGSEGR
jgi:hypothetical protein